MSWWDDRDRIPSDYGEPQYSNPVEMWDDYNDQEVNRLLETDDDCPL